MKRKPREFWADHVRGFEKSGQTRRAYCTAHGLNRNTLDAWRRRIAGRKPGTAAPSFVSLSVMSTAPAGLTLRWPSGAVLALPPDCDPAWLAQVLSGLR